MNIQFEGEFNREARTGTIYFFATIDGRRVRNCIFEESLSDCFDKAEGEDSLRVFERNRSAVEAMAREKIENGDVNDSGGADLAPEDFR
jgi:hypothetical protein